MLTLLKVDNFAIADHVEIAFDEGMSVLTGETGAGKSIILDALGLALGDRADTSMVRHGSERADISAVFEVSAHPSAIAWLSERDLDMEDQCILRRCITAEGRSRSYINGQPSTLQSLKEIGELLIDIHSQHEHQSLLKKDNHRSLLDRYGKLESHGEQVAGAYFKWQQKAKQLTEIENSKEEVEARIQILRFQLDELDSLALETGEIESLEQEQTTLGNAEELLKAAHHALELCDESDNSASSLTLSASHQLEGVANLPSSLSEALNMLGDAHIQLQEAASSIHNFVDHFEMDPARLAWVEERLGTAYQLARKHGCEAKELVDVQLKLREELEQYNFGDNNIDQLRNDVATLKAAYLELAKKQHQQRAKAGKELSSAICEQLEKLSMGGTKFVVHLESLSEPNYSQHGMSSVEFLVSTNPGSPAKPLHKVASGGELSRISLAIQVVLAQTSSIPTLVFDEVDVGIGGGVAEIVGRMLKQLGKTGQIICVTHLAQVASQGHQHFHISKRIEDDKAFSSVVKLNDEERTTEIARMLGGVELTKQTLSHAQEMLDLA